MLLYFFYGLWFGHRLGTAGLLLPVIGGIAATFNPCALPALLAFLSYGSGERRQRTGLAVALGAMTVVMVLGGFVAVAGVEVQDVVAPRFRWVQLAGGVLLVGLAGLHLAGRAEGLAPVRAVSRLGGRYGRRQWRSQPRLAGFLLGAGFVAVGGA